MCLVIVCVKDGFCQIQSRIPVASYTCIHYINRVRNEENHAVMRLMLMHACKLHDFSNNTDVANCMDMLVKANHVCMNGHAALGYSCTSNCNRDT